MISVNWLYIAMVTAFISLQAHANLPIADVIPQLEKYVEASIKQSNVPGMAIAIISNHEIAYIKGFGVRRVGNDALITPDTVFQIASLSKPMSSTIIAALVGEGVIHWNSRISDLDPQFQLQIPWVSRELTIEDLLCHRSGLPDHAGDLLEDLGFKQNVILQRMRQIRLIGFRSTYAYTNFGYTEAALAASKAAKMPWEELVEQKLLAPLSMQSTTTSHEGFMQFSNRADLHVVEDGKAKALLQRNPDAQSAAGGFACSINDFVKWMLLQISEGQYQGKQIIDQKALQQTHIPYMFVHSPNQFYGLGWNISWNKNGEKVLSHVGAFSSGATTKVKLIPEKGFGIAIFTNVADTSVPDALVDIFNDLQETGKVTHDWLTIWKQRYEEALEKPATALAKPVNQSTSLPLEAYVGKYQNEYYGEAGIRLKENQLYFDVGTKSYLLNFVNRDVFSFKTLNESIAGLSRVTFTIDEKGMAKELMVDTFNTNGLGRFTRFNTD